MADAAARTSGTRSCAGNAVRIFGLDAAEPTNKGSTMNIEDMILVSVDDHVVEPPDMFDGHLPGEVRGPGAAGRHARTTAPTSGVYEGQELPNIGLNAVAGRPPEEYGIEPDVASPRCAPAATTSTSASTT